QSHALDFFTQVRPLQHSLENQPLSPPALFTPPPKALQLSSHLSPFIYPKQKGLMRVVIAEQPAKGLNRTRGVGVYTRELVQALRTNFPKDEFVTGTKDYRGADLVHYPFFDPYALTLPLRRPCRTIVTVHDTIPLRFPAHFPAGVRGRLKLRLQKRALASVEHVLTDSLSSRRDIGQYLHYPPEQISVVPLAPGLDRSTRTIADKVRATYSLPRRFLLYVGDINWNKNVPGLVEAFAALSDPRLHLVLVGKVFADKPAIPEFEGLSRAISQSGKDSRIHLLGYLPQHHLPLCYRLATLYVQPSWYEGFGLPVLEAMNQGCPVLSSNRGSLPEVGGSAVAYFDPGKKGTLTASLQALLSDAPSRKELSRLGITQAKQFSWDKTAALTHAVYQTVLSSND
ncbi:glycosyltransferase family 4 protein, partial [Patescibacteria group bacterium]|nr:glycosyltransferase family 4 protein [Patescibacteria group bacterium]